MTCMLQNFKWRESGDLVLVLMAPITKDRLDKSLQIEWIDWWLIEMREMGNTRGQKGTQNYPKISDRSKWRLGGAIYQARGKKLNTSIELKILIQLSNSDIQLAFEYFCCYSRVPWTGPFIKEGVYLGSQFWRQKVQEQDSNISASDGSLITLRMAESSIANGHVWSTEKEADLQYFISTRKASCLLPHASNTRHQPPNTLPLGGIKEPVHEIWGIHSAKLNCILELPLVMPAAAHWPKGGTWSHRIGQDFVTEQSVTARSQRNISIQWNK